MCATLSTNSGIAAAEYGNYCPLTPGPKALILNEKVMNFDPSDILFIVIVLLIAIVLINGSGGGGRRAPVPIC